MTQLTGELNLASVAITGGSITGITDIAVADGGTGASDSSTARTNLGLGSIATQASNNVSITGGTMSGVSVELGAYADVASAATTNIGAATSNNVQITGTTTITAFDTVAAGITRNVRFAGALTLTYNATNLILPTSANIVTAADDCLTTQSLGSGNWIVSDYTRKNGTSLAQTEILISSQTASSSASLSFTGLDSTYRRYKIYLIGVRPATNSTALYLRYSSDNGSTWISAANYNVGSSVVYSGGGGAWGTASDSKISLSYNSGGYTVSNAASAAMNGTVELDNFSNTTFNKQVRTDISYKGTGATTYIMRISGAGDYIGSTVAINAVQIYFSSGNIAEGVFRLYGVY